MRRKVYYLVIALLINCILFSIYGVINTMVSIKYETENPGDCISLVSGKDLCSVISGFQNTIIINAALLIMLTIFRKKLQKRK